MHKPTQALALFLCLLSQGAVAAAADPGGAQKTAYALVIANNATADSSLPPLRYADDDGVRYFELFSELANDARLLAVLDAETQRLYRGVAARAEAPTWANVQGRLGSMFEAMRNDRSRGAEVTFYFVYAGHGGIGENREGYVHLQDGRLTRDMLLHEVIAKSPATYNHVIIDACDSYYMVASRSDRVAVSHGALLATLTESESLTAYPNTGVLLSTSSAQEAHEWSLFGAGVFSHELRSGLLGAADVNADGRIEYSEIKAYIAAANSHVSDPKARIAMHAQAPRVNLQAPLVDLGERRDAGALELARGQSGRYYLEDERGVRYADFNKEQGTPLRIALLPSAFYYLRSDAGELRIAEAQGRVVRVEEGEFAPFTIAARGSASEAFERDLYRVPFGRVFYDGFVASSGDVPAVPETLGATLAPASGLSRFLTPPVIALSVAAGLGIGAGVTGYLAYDAYRDFEREFDSAGTANRSLERSVATRKLWANSLAGAAAAAGLVSLYLFVTDRDRSTSSSTSLSLGVVPVDDGALVSVRLLR